MRRNIINCRTSYRTKSVINWHLSFGNLLIRSSWWAVGMHSIPNHAQHKTFSSLMFRSVHCIVKAQLNATSFNGRRCKTPICPYLYNTTMFCKTTFDIFFVLRSISSSSQIGRVIIGYLTSWFIQNLSKRALNKLTVLTSTTWFGRLFQMLTVRAEK